MSTISSTTPRSASMFSTIALAVALIAVFAFVVTQSAARPKSAVVPATGIQNAYIQYLRGEKAIYANPVAVNNAITAYHLGEKPLVDISNPLSAYRAGEQTLYEVSDLGTALSAYHLGEKMIVPFDVREAALLTWRQGEKDAK